MPIEIVIPRFGWSMDEGTFVEWLKRDGDVVAVGDPLFSLESEKAIQDVEAIDAGILRIPPNGPQAGDVLSVGTVVAYLVEEGEEIADLGLQSAESSQRVRADAFDSDSDQSTANVADSAPPPRADSELRRPTSSPRARRVAKDLGIDWRTVDGSGRNGRIRERDVRAAIDGFADITPFRRTIADRMLAASRETAPVTLTTTADATHLVALRDQFRHAADSTAGLVPTYTDLCAKLVAGALCEHPRLNSRWTDAGIVSSSAVHIGIAVDTDAGLVVPVIRNVESLSLSDVATRAAALIDRARRRSLSAEDMRGGTFTITNLGAYGIDAFTPIINAPECAILGIGAIAPRPVVIDGNVVAREVVTLSLTFDHRIVDGAPAARFLKTVRERVENPSPWLTP